MKDICVLLNCEDVEDFAEYLKELFLKGNLELKINFQNIGEIADLTELSTYKLVVVLCSPCMIEFFDNESEIERFQKILVNHPCIICLQYYVENDDISRLQTALAVDPKSWKLFQNLETKQECTETIASIFDVLEEQSRVPQPTVKPLPKKRLLRKSKRSAKIFPNCVYKANEHVAIIFQKPPNGTVQVMFNEFDKIVDAKESINETTYLFRVPSLPKSGDVRISLLCDSEKTADCVLKIVKPNLAAYECLDFLSQVLGVDANEKQVLDSKLLDLFDKSIPSDGTLAELMKVQAQDMPFQELIESDQEIPTLLHFAAKHGLEDLTCNILDTPGSSAAFQIENKDGHDPADLAELNGHVDLAEHMRTHFETQTMVDYIHLAMDNNYSNQEELERARNQAIDNSRSKSFKNIPTQEKIQLEEKSLTLPRPIRSVPLPPEPTEEEEKYGGMKPDEFMGISSKPIQTASTLGSSTHDELIEIGNAVKNGEFTVDEAERLYSSWVDRNKAAQSKSLKERQLAIEELRNQYQTVFKPEKQLQQRQSIFTKLKQKVSPRKKTQAEEIYVMQITHPSVGRDGKTHTPGRDSTISNSSSSSGGSRGSTMSTQSWRDSSLGSMHEESASDSDGIDCCVDISKHSEDTPVYEVQRRQSEPKESAEKRISLKDQFLQKVKKEEEESPILPPRTSDTFKPGTPPPPSRNRPPLPLPDSDIGKPASSREQRPPRSVGRPLPNIPTNNDQNNGNKPPLPSPMSKRAPAPLPSNTTHKPATPSYKLPPRPPKKMS
ncbi:B-cell scaffold protein with ankyrin repeats-like isoform X2 [Mytilus californianus]|uniref:B-cell scaffold protein with ankyrin repeats-like isoform X2 n=1 Tax=Mytilus californianus TaxID=6549 RepID=UPI00224555F7|nr:B-cell scaffold protein with ankyrin repeats-like isoform X2 [Mytilus californianus]